MKRKVLGAILTLAMVMSMAMPVYGGQSSNVNITLPNFKVTMNGEVVNNDYSKYPLIVYNNITYFPMTYSDCRYLGIESIWKGNKEGLLVDATGVTAAYNPYISSSRNGKSYAATICTFPIKVNGKAVDNSKEQYPLLSFRDITYFPMTWKYSVEQFGWDYSFDGKNGLVIKSKNKKLQQISLPKDRANENQYSIYAGRKSTCVMVKSGYLYYDNSTGGIMQAPLSNTAKVKKLYQLQKDLYSEEDYDRHCFYEENGKAMLYYHSGGATMGADYRLELNSDGTTREIQSDYHQTTAIGDKLFMVWVGPMPGPGGLSMQKKGQTESVSIGGCDYWYDTLLVKSFGGIPDLAGCFGGVPDVSLIGNQLYLRASKVLQKASDGSYKLDTKQVYKVNIDTNEVTKVSNSKEAVDTAQIEGDNLYYLSKGNIYKMSLQDGKEVFLGKAEGLPEFESEIIFKVLGGRVYFAKENKQLYTLGNNVSLNPNAELVSIRITGDNKEYLACTFRETTNAKYRIIVFDKSGKVIFKTSDCGSNVTVEGNTLYFYNITTENACSCKIK
ncbi:hypothetical protein [Aminipila terrae]|uniref:DUF5050 domain-containing protein n=1 Tax=Aminipila terrae TaxID=2697030 RepID=A0A6P1M900_9FIRM|nr:hypothetical protein [Aminipila terrae]QHI71209.1 hypothetical protein Ami3637_01295 [Aminipila terrae]